MDPVAVVLGNTTLFGPQNSLFGELSSLISFVPSLPLPAVPDFVTEGLDSSFVFTIVFLLLFYSLLRWIRVSSKGKAIIVTGDTKRTQT